MKILDYINYRTVKKFLTGLLISLLNDDSEEYDGIRVLGVKKAGNRSFVDCVQGALALLKEERPVEYRILKKNVSYIVFESGSPSHAAKFMHSCCAIPWNTWTCYSMNVLNQIMAASLAHEAYRGECINRYGVRAYGNEDLERKYHERAVRILQHFKISADESSALEYEKRINEYKMKGSASVSSRCGISRK